MLFKVDNPDKATMDNCRQMRETHWIKVQLQSVRPIDRNFVLQTLKTSLGFPFKFAAWHKLVNGHVNFYVQNIELATLIMNTPVPGLTIRINERQNPPAAQVTRPLKQQLMSELTSRLSRTGHLDLKNFAETNELIWDHWLPLHKPIIAAMVSETIIQANLRDKILSVDLSHNKLFNFNDLVFLHNSPIKILLVNDNRIQHFTDFTPIKSRLLTDLVIKNNACLYSLDTGSPLPQELVVGELLKLFPCLEALDQDPLMPSVGGQLKRPALLNYDHQQPSKMAKLSIPVMNNPVINNPLMNSPVMRISRNPIAERLPENNPNYGYIAEPARSERGSVSGAEDDLAKMVIFLDKRVTETTNQVEVLTKMCHELSEKQAKTEKSLQLVEEENLRLRIEVRQLQQQQNLNPMSAASSSQTQRLLAMSSEYNQPQFGSEDTQYYDRPIRR